MTCLRNGGSTLGYTYTMGFGVEKHILQLLFIETLLQILSLTVSFDQLEPNYRLFRFVV